jgi:hypothetical protein
MPNETNQPTLPLMIGVVHRDPAGEERLLAALRLLRPGLLTVEVSPYAVAFREEHGERLAALLEQRVRGGKRRHSEIEAIRETLRLPFEVRAARRYAAEADCVVELVDDSEVSRQLLAAVETELLTEENLRALTGRADVPLTRTVDSFYRRTRRLRADEPVAPVLLGFSPERLALLQVRDDGMGERIEAARGRHAGRSWLHVGGVVHLLDVRGLRLLWSQLADQGVGRIFLDEF